jgi:hypothetical protein
VVLALILRISVAMEHQDSLLAEVAAVGPLSKAMVLLAEAMEKMVQVPQRPHLARSTLAAAVAETGIIVAHIMVVLADQDSSVSNTKWLI